VAELAEPIPMLSFFVLTLAAGIATLFVRTKAVEQIQTEETEEKEI